MFIMVKLNNLKNFIFYKIFSNLVDLQYENNIKNKDDKLKFYL